MTPLSTELSLLVWSVLLFLVMVLAGSMIRAQGWTPAGMARLFGNRDDTPAATTGLAGRADRAWRNMMEAMVMFAPLVLAADAAGVSNASTVLGAQLFFWARLVYFPVYLIGIPYLRTAVWAVGVVGLAIIFLELV